jgi:hypothetical protein
VLGKFQQVAGGRGLDEQGGGDEHHGEIRADLLGRRLLLPRTAVTASVARIPWARTMADWAPVTLERSFSWRKLTTWSTTNTVTDSTSSPPTIEVVNALSSHQ